MTLDQNSLIAIALILSVTVITAIALTRNTNTKLRVNFGNDKFLILEGEKPLLTPEKTKIDCLPGEENSQLLECDS
ncbi:MAG: hypothetical protein ACRC2S_13590 [Waterburya sp.]